MEKDEQRLHICFGTHCNNNCVFCMEEDRAARSRRFQRIDRAAAVEIMSSATTRNEVMFTAGEPTLREDLPQLARAAKELGFAQVGMITNARRLAYRQYLDELLDAGINYILVSIHGHTSKLHDGLTRTPGAFDNVVAGLGNIVAARREGRPLRFVTTTVLNRRNLPTVGELIEFLLGFAPDQIVFNAIQPLGRGETYFKQLVPRYSEMVTGFAAALERFETVPEGVLLLDIPRCVTRVLPAAAVGFVERHSHFEPETEVLDAVSGAATPSETDGKDGELVLVTKEQLDQALRTMGPDCPKCLYYNECDGVWRKYADEYGFEEFRPQLSGGEEGDE